MRPRILLLAAVQFAAVSVAGAQTKTADGVEAFLRGDYQRAAEILKPLAESWPSRDHAAEFFMAALYDGNHGLPADQMRACALYTRASLDHSSPLSVQADAILVGFSRSMSAEAFQECTTLAAVGLGHGVQPVTFTLEPGYWVAIDFQGATVSYNGKEERTDLSIDYGGIRLATEHTELMVGGSTRERRHFIEFFTWTPIENTWQLGWDVYEVVRDVLVRVAGGELMRIAGERPPTEPVDIRALAELRVNEQGRAEWGILSGRDRDYGLIATEAEKRQHAEQQRAREAAEAATDWSKVFDVKRPPTLTYSDGDGCGNIFLFGWSQNRAEIITLKADKESLALSTTPRTFNLARHLNDLELLVHVYDRPLRNSRFCTDVFSLPKPLTEIWRVVAGTATIEISLPGVSPFASKFAYRATVRIVGAEFVSESGVRVRQVQPITLTAMVGFGW